MSGKICFDFICDEALIFSSVASRFQSEGQAVCGITLGNRWSEGWHGKFEVTSLDIVEEGVDWELELSRISRQYHQHTPARFTQADRHICLLDRELQMKILVNTFLQIEKTVENGVTMFFTTGVAFLYNLVILAVAANAGVRAISLYSARQPDPRFTYSSSKGGIWDPISRSYQQSRKREALDLTEQVDYIQVFRKKIRTPDYMKYARQEGGIKWVFIKEFLVRLKRWYTQGWNQDADYMTQHPFWYVRRDVGRVFYKLLLDAMFSFDAKNEDDQYYLYPLHVQPEASTLILGDDYVDQLHVIRSVAKRLPADHVLYVKEHPAAYGRHSLGFYREVQKIYNVKLIDFREDTRRLVSGARAVVVVSGTMGWEAMLLGVPSIVLGAVFYDQFVGTYKVESLQDLELLLLENDLRSPTLEDAAFALHAVRQGSFPGFFNVHKLDTTEDVLDKDNLDRLYSGIREIVTDQACA